MTKQGTKKRRPDLNPLRTGHSMPEGRPQGSSQLLALSLQVNVTSSSAFLWWMFRIGKTMMIPGRSMPSGSLRRTFSEFLGQERSVASVCCNGSIFGNEELRLQSFKYWSPSSPVGAAALVKAGLFYTGKSDTVQCFSCRGYLHEWEEGDDPLEEHAKFFPNCQFLQSVKSSAEVIPDLQSHDELPELTGTTSESHLEESTAVGSVVPEVAQGEAQWFQEAESLSERLRKVYTSAPFCHMSLLEVSSLSSHGPVAGL